MRAGRLILSGIFLALPSAALADPIAIYCEDTPYINFDPALDNSLAAYQATYSTIFNRLVKIEGGQIVPDLAASWYKSEDGLDYTFILKPDVPFQTTDYFTPHNKFTADDVVFSFDRQMNPSSPFHSYSGGDTQWLAYDATFKDVLNSVNKLDDRAVKFTLRYPDPNFLNKLTGNVASILSSEYANRLYDAGDLDKLTTEPIGTGPFAVVKYDPGVVIAYRAAPDYFDQTNKPAGSDIVLNVIRRRVADIAPEDPMPGLGSDCVNRPSWDTGSGWSGGGHGGDGSTQINTGGTGTDGTNTGGPVTTGNGGGPVLVAAGQPAPILAPPRSGGSNANSGVDGEAGGYIAGIWPAIVSEDPERTYPSFPIPTQAQIDAKATAIPNPIVGVPTDDAFMDMLPHTAQDLAAGPVKIPFFRYGFIDTVLIKTGGSKPEECSGVLLDKGYVLTVEHCVTQFDQGGAVYVVDTDAGLCLSTTEPDDRHPADRCAIPNLQVIGSPLIQYPGRDSSLALIHLESTGLPKQVADIDGIYSGKNPVLTFAGRGHTRTTDALPRGTVEVAWGRLMQTNPLDSTGPNGTYRFKLVDEVGSSCGGDSGGGVYRGRLFGYGSSDGAEQHYLIGLMTGGPSTCDAQSNSDSIVVSTQTPEALSWICDNTGNALTVCEWNIKL
ncbi:MAG: trypsin-like serine protease [Devosia nanyangense]|uniref:Trypsin-like serine protease n=1 Tax=Devosia nanyangense TaxID=1228055 RepID=A0A933NY81_9HYPH|nr:trypsin-like serine protease [Devosia nanyangense]